MTEHQRQTAFLVIFLSDDSDQRRKLDEQIARVQRDERCVQHAMWLMGLFTALSAAGLVYEALLQENFLYGESGFSSSSQPSSDWQR